MDIKKEVIEAHALANAVNHGGKASSGAVINALFAEGLKKEEISEVAKLVGEVLEKVNALSLDEQKKKFDKIGAEIHKRDVRGEGELPDLPNVKEKVVMRMAPFPSGPLHIGNARPYIINDEYVKKYGGKLIFVIDDTIGSVDKPVEKEAYKLIEEGVGWLGIKHDKKIIYKSDRLEIYYGYALEMIKKGYMYVCDCDGEKFKKLRDSGIDCPCRHLAEEEHVSRWEKMLDGKVGEGEMVVRLKTSMQSANPAFRDRVMFKIAKREHPRIGKKYPVWPSLDFSWAIDDHLLGITHILRGIDLQMESEVEKFIWKIFGWDVPEILYTGFLSIEGVKISKSKGAKEVRGGQYIGWNDPRLWSLQSLRDRGIQPEAIRKFIVGMGVTKSNSVVSVEILYTLNRSLLKDVQAFMFVDKPVKIKIAGAPMLKKDLGGRVYETEQEFYISERDAGLMGNGKYRLMGLFNFEADEVLHTKPKYYSFVDEKSEEKLKAIPWVPILPKDGKRKNLKIVVRMDDGSLIEGLAEPEVRKLNVGDVVRFEKFGFCRLHKKNSGEGVYEFWFGHA